MSQMKTKVLLSSIFFIACSIVFVSHRGVAALGGIPTTSKNFDVYVSPIVRR